MCCKRVFEVPLDAGHLRSSHKYDVRLEVEKCENSNFPVLGIFARQNDAKLSDSRAGGLGSASFESQMMAEHLRASCS